MVKLRSPMSALVLHYDQSPTSVCEATGLIHSNMERLFTAAAEAAAAAAEAGKDGAPFPPPPPQPTMGMPPALPKEKLTVLVSPTFYRQRKRFYGESCTVKPLLFEWSSLSADHIKKLMRIEEGDAQLCKSRLFLFFSISCSRLLRTTTPAAAPR